MTKKATLRLADKEFFRKVSEAAFANPFSEERTELDIKIAGYVEGGSHRATIDTAIEKVSGHVKDLEAKGKADIRLYEGSERDLVMTVLLFDLFYRHIDNFYSLINDQVKAGDAPCPVPFAEDALADFARHGFSSEESLRFFAILYQLIRAYHFINNGLIGFSPSMKILRMHLWNSIFTHNMRWYDTYLWDKMEDFATLLLGETGTGKGPAASAIGRSGFIPFDVRKVCFSESFTRNFISINLSQYHEALIESELFGHKKGAFTGAIENHEGVFSRCTPHGAIFIDEIGDVSVPVQIKLLQILQERTFSPVGGHEKMRFRGRVIAATNKSIDEMRQQKKFRDDFFYRLCSDIITVPTLRQRLEEDSGELDILLSHLISRMIGHAGSELVEMVRTAINLDIGKHYSWPGNVRELEQAVRRILITRHYKEEPSLRSLDLRDMVGRGIDAGTLDAATLVKAYCHILYRRYKTYEEVARRTDLDRRTVKKHIQSDIEEALGPSTYAS